MLSGRKSQSSSWGFSLGHFPEKFTSSVAPNNVTEPETECVLLSATVTVTSMWLPPFLIMDYSALSRCFVTLNIKSNYSFFISVTDVTCHDTGHDSCFALTLNLLCWFLKESALHYGWVTHGWELCERHLSTNSGEQVFIFGIQGCELCCSLQPLPQWLHQFIKWNTINMVSTIINREDYLVPCARKHNWKVIFLI